MPVENDTPEKKEAEKKLVEVSKVDQKVVTEQVAAAVDDQAKEGKITEKQAKDAKEVVSAMVRKVPNCHFLALNGYKITVAKATQVIKVPRAFLAAFPNYLAEVG